MKDKIKEKISTLPLKPGVYLMKDKLGNVIYVGKAKKLKNRVGQYFFNLASHNLKTKVLVSQIDDFDIIIADSEFEALVLENSLIKKYRPKYNILLKDDKGYPFIRLDLNKNYPKFEIVSKKENDNARYFGPYGGRQTTKNVIDSVLSALKLPTCKKNFEKQKKKERPCLNYHLGRCLAFCNFTDQREYMELMHQAVDILDGKCDSLISKLNSEMLEASDRLEFEKAARIRDKRNAVIALHTKQRVVAVSNADTDVIGVSNGMENTCITVLHYVNGSLLEKDSHIFDIKEEQDAVTEFIKQYYTGDVRKVKTVLLPTQLEDSELIERLVQSSVGSNIKFIYPQRGDKRVLVLKAVKNASDDVMRYESKKAKGAYIILAESLGIKKAERIESFDISNLSGTDTVASMVVFTNGKPDKKEYRQFKIKSFEGQNDCLAMYEVILRRLKEYKEDNVKFSVLPDVMLIDGGVNQVNAAIKALNEMNVSIPVFGMVKDNKHKTRAICTVDGKEINLSNQAIFAFVGTIQEETHRFAIDFNKKLRNKRIAGSTLENIKGIGKERRVKLIKHFKSVDAIKNASFDELRNIVPENIAKTIIAYFDTEDKK